MSTLDFNSNIIYILIYLLAIIFNIIIDYWRVPLLTQALSLLGGVTGILVVCDPYC